MRCPWFSFAALPAALGLPVVTFAERPPEERSQAWHVILCMVAGVYTRDEQDRRPYLAEIAVVKDE
jgi:hypothetical protein